MKDETFATVYQPARSTAAMVLPFRCDRQKASHGSSLDCCEVIAGSSARRMSTLAGALSEGRSGQVGTPFCAASTIVMATGRFSSLCFPARLRKSLPCSDRYNPSVASLLL